MDTKKKMSNRDKMFLFIIAAIAIVAVVYFFVFAKMNEKRAALVAENATLQEEVTKLENMEAQKESVLEETKETQLKVAEVLDRFPTEVRTENAIYDLNDLYESISDVKIQSESFTMNEVFYQQGAINDGSSNNSESTVTSKTNPASVSAITEDTPVSEVVSAAADYTGYRSTVNVSFTAPYKSLKKVIDYINQSDDRMTITEISATKSDEDEALTCSMTICMYAISGTGEIYEAPDVSNGNVGVGNIFRN